MSYEPPPAGTYICVCDMVADLGWQENTWQGKTSKKPQIYIRWQVPSQMREWTGNDGQTRQSPLVFGEIYTNSMNEKATFRKHLEAWRAKPFRKDQLDSFDPQCLIGVPALVTIIHKKGRDRVFPKVAAVARMPFGIEPPALATPGIFYDARHRVQFDRLPKWIKEKIGPNGGP